MGVDMAAGIPGELFHVNFKVNCQGFGLNSKYHVIAATAVLARAKAIAIGTAYKRILPSDADLVYATVSNDNSQRDSKYIPEIRGDGEFINVDPDVTPSFTNDAQTAVRIRFEHEGGASDTRLINPVPDRVVAAQDLLTPPDAVTATYAGVDPVAGVLSTYKLQLENFMKVITKYAVNLRSGHIAGGAFVYNVYNAAYYVGIGKKKGGRASR